MNILGIDSFLASSVRVTGLSLRTGSQVEEETSGRTGAANSKSLRVTPSAFTVWERVRVSDMSSKATRSFALFCHLSNKPLVGTLVGPVLGSGEKDKGSALSWCSLPVGQPGQLSSAVDKAQEADQGLWEHRRLREWGVFGKASLRNSFKLGVGRYIGVSRKDLGKRTFHTGTVALLWP